MSNEVEKIHLSEVLPGPSDLLQGAGEMAAAGLTATVRVMRAGANAGFHIIEAVTHPSPCTSRWRSPLD